MSIRPTPSNTRCITPAELGYPTLCLAERKSHAIQTKAAPKGGFFASLHKFSSKRLTNFDKG